ncbi:hypothetical protein DMENIID0001_121410 [Sergentomyia squamirostris]
MEKTAVSILQEVCVKYQSCPIYEDLPTDLDNYFEYSVQAFGLVVHASGMEKKEAKQNVARKMLDYLHALDILGENSEIDAIQNFVNHVGDLMEFCRRHMIPLPLFDLISVRKTNCPRRFHVRCRVGNIETRSRDVTKKRAKHAAAKAMKKKLTVFAVSEKTDTQRAASNSGSSENCYFKLEEDAIQTARKLLARKTSKDDKVVLNVCRLLNIPYKQSRVIEGNQQTEVFEMNFTYSYVNVSKPGKSCVQAKKYLRSLLDSLSSKKL